MKLSGFNLTGVTAVITQVSPNSGHCTVKGQIATSANVTTS